MLATVMALLLTAGPRGEPLPPEALPGQKTACQPERGEVSINGGCYKELAAKPPCHPGEYIHGGKCWIALAASRRPEVG